MDAHKRSILWQICLWIAIFNVSVNCLKKKVCVVGAGPGGLTAIKQLSMWPDYFEPVAFEKNSDVGGQWIYTDLTDFDEHGLPVHSSIYKYLRTNGPKQVIAFPDYQEFHGENRSYVKHETVLEYVRNFTAHFNLRRFIKLNTLVEKVSLHDGKYIVMIRNLESNARNAVKCAAIMISTGNFHKPNIPKIDGIENFRGRVLHSHAYRRPEEFANQTVVVLGASFSGTDIANELTSYAAKVYLSHRYSLPKNMIPANMVEISAVESVNDNKLILNDGSAVTADALILCTGYLYDYPFLSEKIGIEIDEGKYVHPLYKHFINARHPTMAILGLLHPGLPFQLLYVQAYFFTAYLRGLVKLPSETEMLIASELPPNVPVKKAHFMDLEVLKYYEDLQRACGADPLPAFFKKFIYIWYHDFHHNPLHFKENDFIINGDEVQLIRHQQSG